ncbi:S-methyl-5-thioadenosine phosphorylase [Exophiala xenobiotica]|uniref:S-methyl-5'-thioadenosine phosphorylase n=1 Tax=Vermiconidia calcicola TaxID=1690605 RepID=A0AAV9QCI6_9PEZI|nr:S-methyl-5-thioadenosine phosphorylase [Exophiala xenobiotica]KAK5536930.1 S-methyl-5-thioadenosine phosphorylase [Chaetothyriales sp. CCFEE 6169]KAK5537611.1 S-methyl-5-thioadenosine phosphorylase [Vermiconidia calcicola]KAK5301474.1 S-methyl-5-thioadenosine phosphorylase [Exophiala xenobiotica]KAK5334993.1 S-methyl-5-thioadenosine phosphorylase [Exophiala xenobiotica]
MTPDSENVPTSYSGPVHIAVIGGTGLEHLPHFHKAAVLTVDTPWGAPSSAITILEHPSPTHPDKQIAIAFLARHGAHHELNPSEIPVRANIAALRKLGVRCIIAFSAAGSLAEEVKPRDFVVPDQVIDRTKGIRPHTFFEDGFVVHVPFADPFDKRVGDVVRKCGHSLEGEGVVLHDKGVVIVMEGPQFSTRAESNMYRSWGGTVINMSTLPEAKLAAEAEIAYQVILMSTDYDCWHDSGDVSVEMVMGHMRANALNARRFIAAVLDELSKEEHEDLVKATHLQGAREFGISTAPAGRSQQATEKMKWLFEGYFES